MSGINYNFHKQESSTLGKYVDSDGTVKRDTDTRLFNPKNTSSKFNERHKKYEEQKRRYRMYRKQGMRNSEIKKQPDMNPNTVQNIILELGTRDY